MKKVIYLLTIFILLSTMAFSQTDEKKQQNTKMKPALLILDVQKRYLPMMSQDDQELAIQIMNWAIWVFRQHDLPVIRIYHTDPDHGPKPGDPDFEYHDSLIVTNEDPKIIKLYPSGFTKTDLDKLLKEKGINTVFICGLSSVGCALATYFDTYAYEYKGFLIKDALLSHKSSYTDSIEEIFSALDLDTVMYMIEIGTD
jgi:nicotinamidase-related amidase